jgi:NAD(P)-dependent dehydrogenase (short-subunit alcohol dehydrogenase family)
MRLQDKAAIVTGAASGMGQASAVLFAENRAQVLAVDRPGTDLAGTAQSHQAIRVLEADIADAGAPERIIAHAVGAFGRLDILMNNAGVSHRAPVEEMQEDDWDRVCAVNVRAQFLLCRAAIPHLKASGAGRIINVASVMAEGTDFGLAAYCASKAGVAGLTRTLALELGRFGITANYIEPGAILTGMTAKAFSDPHIAEVWAKKSPLKRLGQPIDIARGALFLASDDGAFVTGHGLRIDGGLMLRC